ncbi:hypothetical protein NSS94_25755 [Paenibacillus sp. FSL L8-0644]|uniref:hypothetical protein n=1 Tax=Paenibacillus sp. FSL L8-0644 TaxID=2954523 RepID=UPI0030F5A01C
MDSSGNGIQLLKQAHRAYNTEMNDLLLTALGLTIHRWAGLERVLVFGRPWAGIHSARTGYYAHRGLVYELCSRWCWI